MIEKFKEFIDKGHQFGALLTDFSKAFDCIDHKLLMAKLCSYGISFSSINLLSSYLSNLTQQIKINDCFRLINIDSMGLFFICENDDDATYADGTHPTHMQGTLLL